MTTSSFKWSNIATLWPAFFREKNVATPQKTTYLARLAYKSSGERMGTSRGSPAALIISKIMFFTSDLGYYCQKRKDERKIPYTAKFPRFSRVADAQEK